MAIITRLVDRDDLKSLLLSFKLLVIRRNGRLGIAELNELSPDFLRLLSEELPEPLDLLLFLATSRVDALVLSMPLQKLDIDVFTAVNPLFQLGCTNHVQEGLRHNLTDTLSDGFALLGAFVHPNIQKLFRVLNPIFVGQLTFRATSFKLNLGSIA